VIVLLPLFWLDAGRCLGDVVVGRPDRAPFSLDGGFYRLRTHIRELEPLGRCPGRCRVAVGFIPFFVTGVYFGSIQSMRAMGRFQLRVAFGFFFVRQSKADGS
jgi:hypothetical protein